LQVASFKTRGKRIFKIAPVHHHFEALGYKETKIVMSFFVVACLISAIVVSPFFLNGIN
jgi:phospho-N-acetylmuramoyl-pentapeptide-transferase